MIQFKPASSKPTYEDFYSSNFERIVQYINKKIGNLDDAQDIASDVFLYCYTHYDDYDPNKSSITTWLYLIVNSRIKNHYRDSKTYVDIDELAGILPADETDMDACILLEQMKTRLRQAIKMLPERQQDIVRMSYFEGRTSKDIAETLGITPINVRVLLSRALKVLEKHCSNLWKGAD